MSLENFIPKRHRDRDHQRLTAVLERAQDLDEGDERAEIEGLSAVTTEMQRPYERPTVTPLEEIAGLVLDLRWIELVTWAKELADEGKLPDGVDLAPVLWAWSHKMRGAAA